MKIHWIWALLLGALVGSAAGYGAFCFFYWVFFPPASKGSTLLHNFSFQDVAKKAGHPTWEIIEDKTYSPFPPLGRPHRTARRIVALASMSDKELEDFARQFQNAAKEALQNQGANLTGVEGPSRSASRAAPTGAVRSELELPRHYYRVGDIHGVADAWLIGQSGEVTVIVCLSE